MEPTKLAFSIDELAKAVSSSRSILYEEITAGRLKPRKNGARTIVDAEEARRWLASLPTWQPSAPAGTLSKPPRTTAPVERPPKKRREPAAESADAIQTHDPLLRAARTNVDVVMSHFLAERERLWPKANSPAAAAIEKLRSEAERLLRSGSASELITTLSDQMALMASKGLPAPSSIRSTLQAIISLAAAKEGATAAQT